MARSIKKGPFVDHHLLDKVERRARRQRQAPDQDLVAALDHPAGLRRPDDRRAQRQAAHPGVHHREHGRATSSASSRTRASSRATRGRQGTGSRGRRGRRRRTPRRRPPPRRRRRRSKETTWKPQPNCAACGSRPRRAAWSPTSSAASRSTTRSTSCVQPEEGRHHHQEGARVGDRQRRAQRRRRHRRAEGDARSTSRTAPFLKRFQARAKGRGNRILQAHLPHLSHGRRREKGLAMGQKIHPIGLPPRASTATGLALVREQQELPGACCSRTSRCATS